MNAEFKAWQTGVVLSVPADKLPETASPRAYNTQLPPRAGGALSVQVRPGLSLIGQPSTTANATYKGLTSYRYPIGTSFTNYLIGVTDNSKLWDIDSTPSEITPSGVTLSGTGRWRFAQANKRVYGTNGTVQLCLYRTDGSSTITAIPWGIIEPSNAPTQNTLSAGAMTGTVDIAISWYNSTLGIESSRSAELTVALSSQKILINRNNTTPPTGVDYWRVYVRNQSFQSEFWRDDTMQIAVGTTTFELDFDETELGNMLTEDPTQYKNDPPPSGIIDLAWHQSRMFATDGNLLYYSTLELPDQFDATVGEPVFSGDGQIITALLSINKTTLAIFKSKAIYLLLGDTPESWRLEKVDTPYGCINVGGAALGNGIVGFISADGPCLWKIGEGSPQAAFNEIWQPLADAGILDQASTVECVEFDKLNHRFLFTLPTTGSAARWTIAPYNTLHDCWESIGWDTGDVTAMCVHTDSDGDERVALGLPDKVAAFLTPNATTDLAGNSTGSGLYFPILSGATTTEVTFTHSGASIPFRTSGVSKCTVVDVTTGVVHRTTYSIAGTTTRTVTLTDAMTTAPTVGSIIAFDIPVWEIDTPEWDGESPHYIKRFLMLWADIEAVADLPAVISVYMNGSATAGRTWAAAFLTDTTKEFVTAGASISGSTYIFKKRIALRGNKLKVRFIGWYPLKRWSLTHLAWETLEGGDER